MRADMAGPLFHVIDTHAFDRPLLDELCALTTRVRGLAKTAEGALALQELGAQARAMLYFPQPSTRTFLSFYAACQLLGVQPAEVNA